MNGLTLDVLRNGRNATPDPTLANIDGRYYCPSRNLETITVTWVYSVDHNGNELSRVRVKGAFAPNEQRPEYHLRVKDLGGLHLSLINADPELKGRHSMASGNYAETSDSRWADALRAAGMDGYWGGAVAIHDRYER